MKNVELSIKGEILTITVDLSKNFGFCFRSAATPFKV